MTIESPAFHPDQPIPPRYTCDGEDINPPLAIADILDGTRSLALIVDDPDAPNGDWVHWLVWNIDPETTEIAENTVPSQAVQGITSAGTAGYGGPCPPSGTHRYFFKLYALDTLLDLPFSAKKKDLLAAMEKHTLKQAELIGTYQRQR